jgi:hypothetical protein
MLLLQIIDLCDVCLRLVMHVVLRTRALPPGARTVWLPGGHFGTTSVGQYDEVEPPSQNFCPAAFSCRFWMGEAERTAVTVKGGLASEVT